MLARGGQGDWTLGHVSARGPHDTIYMKGVGAGLNEVTPEDIVTIDLDGRKIAGRNAVHGEYPLHTEVYRLRQDVGAVIHTHPPYGIALGVTNARLEFLGHDSVLFWDGISVYRETAELITLPEQGHTVAAALGTRRALLLGNHGILVTGKNVPWAVITALTLERAIRIQTYAQALGPLCPMSPEMVQRLYPTKYSDSLIEQYWRYLIREIRRDSLDDHMPVDTSLGE